MIKIDSKPHIDQPFEWVYPTNFPIHHAIRSCDSSSAIELIESSYKTNALALRSLDCNGDSPLHLAIQNQLGGVIDVLVLFGANTEKINSRGDTLQEALEKRQFRFSLFVKLDTDSKEKRSKSLPRLVEKLEFSETEAQSLDQTSDVAEASYENTRGEYRRGQRYRRRSYGPSQYTPAKAPFGASWMQSQNQFLNYDKDDLNLSHADKPLNEIENELSAKLEKRPILNRSKSSSHLLANPRVRSDKQPTNRQSRSFSKDSLSSLFNRSHSASMGSTSIEESLNGYEMNPYLNGVKKMLEEQRIDLLSQTYFIFVDEDVLFDHLLQIGEKYRKPISGFFLSLIIDGFPNGIDKLTAVSDKLIQLTQSCQIDLPFLNQIAMGSIVSKNPFRTAQTQNEISAQTEQWYLFHPSQLAEMLTFRDVVTISEIQFSEIRNWLNDEKNISTSIENVGKNFSKTVKWISSMIKTCEVETQDQTIKYFVDMGSILLKNANFHGAMQISAAFDLSGCSHKISKYGQNAIALLNFSHFHNNYHYYQAAVKSLPERTLYLPYLSLVWRDMKLNHQVLTNDSCSQMKIPMLDNLSTSVKQLLNFRKTLFSTPKWNESSTCQNFLFNLPDLAQ